MAVYFTWKPERAGNAGATNRRAGGAMKKKGQRERGVCATCRAGKAG